MREFDQKGVLNGDVIDGIMMEDKKEVDKVILTGVELSKYFGKEATQWEMKEQMISCWTIGRDSRRKRRIREHQALQV